MAKRASIIFFFFLPPCFAFAEIKGHGVEVRLTSPKLVEVEPGRFVTASFLVSDNTDREEEFFEELKLPPDWHIIIPLFPFRLKAREQQLRIFAFSVPSNFPSGRYEVTYSVRSQRDYGITDSDTFSVTVIPLIKVETFLEDKPVVVIAGETYNLRLRLVNRGNAETKIKLGIKGSPDYPVKIEESEIILRAGASQVIGFEVKTDETLNQRIIHVLKIRTEIEEIKKIVSEEKTVSIDVIPKITGVFDPYHRLHTQIKFIGAGKKEKGEGGKSGFQVEFSGSGFLDEEGEKKIDFLFRGPDIQDKSIFGERDEYRLSYYDSLLDLHIGDRSYSLSPLTETYRYGRGAEVDIHPGKFGVGAFYLETRWDEPKKRELGTYLQYQFNDTFGIKGNFLSKIEDSDSPSMDFHDKIYSIQARIRLEEKTDLEVEYGFSNSNREKKSTDNAYRIDLKGQLSDQTFYSFEKIRAGPKYFAYYNDADYTSGTITFPIYEKLKGNVLYRAYKDNLDLDPVKSTTTTREKSYSGGISYPFPFGTNVSLDYEDFCKKDRLSPADFDFKENILKLGLGQIFWKFNLQLYIERGLFEDRLTDTTNNNFENYSVYAYFALSSWQTYSFNARFGHDRYTGSLERTRSAGVSGAWNFKNLNVDVSYQKSNFETEKRQAVDNLLSTIVYTLPNQHSLTLKGRWFKDREGKEEETSFLLAYAIPLELPISKKKSIGMLKGRVYDGEKPEKPPITNAILTANGATAVTNKKGEFIFPSLAPGTHLLRIEKGSIGLQRVTSEKLPIIIEVKGGETAQVEIAVVRACKISGRVALFASNSNDRNNLKEIRLLSDILVEINDGKEIVRQLTDENGRFSFDDLRPGKWTVKVYEENLPIHHYVEPAEYQVELKPGEEKDIMVKVLPRIRPIQIIDEGEIK